MAGITSTKHEIFDAMAKLVIGPAMGTITLTSATDRVPALRGLTGTLQDGSGRKVRLTDSQRVWVAGTTCPARLLWLTPNSPAKNFAEVPVDTEVIWTDPPAGIDASGFVATAFAAGEIPTVQSIGYSRQQSYDDEMQAVATLGNSALILHAPKYAWIDGGGIWARRRKGELTWNLRLWLSTGAGQQERQLDSERAILNIQSAIDGITCGADVLWLTGEVETTKHPKVSSFDISFKTLSWEEGAVLTDFDENEPPPVSLDLTLTLPGNDDQPGPFVVEEILPIPA